MVDAGIVQKDEIRLGRRYGATLTRMTDEMIALLPDCATPFRTPQW
jgi:hypothetical protein